MNELLQIAKPNFDKLAPAIKAQECLHLWHKELGKDGQPNKVPCNWFGKNRDPFNPDIYLDVEDAKKRIERNAGKFGIAIALGNGGVAKEIDGRTYWLWCLDLDGFMHKISGDVDTEGDAICALLNTYTETSDSNTGAKAFFWSDTSPCTKYDIKFGDSPYASAFPTVGKYTKRTIEVFSQKRFLALSGARTFQGLDELRVIPAQELANILNEADKLAKASGGFGRTDVESTGKSKGAIQSSSSLAATRIYAKPFLEDIHAVLKFIDADDEQVWSDTLNGLARTYGEDGRGLAHEYSNRSYKYEESECNTRYDRALVEAAKKPEGLTTWSIIQKAKAHPDWPKGFDIRYENTIAPDPKGIFGTPPPASPVIPAEAKADVANAQRYVTAADGRMLWVPELKSWLRWDDTIWTRCYAGEEMELAKHVAMAMVREAANLMSTDQDRGQKLMQLAMNAQNLPKLEAMIKLARSSPGLTVRANKLDADPMLLGVKNGVVDLRTGSLRAADPKVLITKSCNAAFDRHAQCPLWLKFLDDVFQNDAETIESIQRALGYTLTGSNTEEKLFICVGYGSNGKSVFANIIHAILGDYAKTTNGSLLVARKAGDTSARDDIAGLSGCRYVGINETQAGDRLDEQGVKMLAGREPITARFMYGSLFSYIPQFTPWLRTNHQPVVTGTDNGIWRRLVLIEFAREFSDSEQDPDLEQKLMAEQDGILAWMLEGTDKYLHHGRLKLSTRIRKASAQYRDDSDILGEFLQSETETDLNRRVEVKILWKRYVDWCTDGGYKYGTRRSLTRRMLERGFPVQRSNGKDYYVGVAAAVFKCSAVSA